MRNLVSSIVIVMILAILFRFAGAMVNDSEAVRAQARAAEAQARAEYVAAWGQAQADIIRAKGEARLDFSQAAMPWAVLGIAVVFGSVALVFLLKIPSPAGQRKFDPAPPYVLLMPPAERYPERYPAQLPEEAQHGR